MTRDEQAWKQAELYLEVTHAIGDRLLSALDAVCAELGITYVVIGGTLLGAVRSGGWIPWDDDIDVAMSRDDFEKFRAAANSILPQGVMYCDMWSDSAYLGAIPRLLYLDSEKAEWGREYKETPPYLRHVGLDIFVLDRAPATGMWRSLWRWCVRFLEVAVVARGVKPLSLLADRTISFKARSAATAVGLISRVFPSSLWRRLYREVVTWSSRRGHADVYMLANDQPRIRKLTFCQADFFPPRRVQFEELTVTGPRQAEEFLARVYGVDFMEPPVEGAREVKHMRSGLRWARIGGKTIRF